MVITHHLVNGKANILHSCDQVELVYIHVLIYYNISNTIDTQDKVICNENMNCTKIQNKEEVSENIQDK